MNTQSEEARARLTEVADNAGSFDRCAVVVSFDDALRLLLAFHPIDKDAGMGREESLGYHSMGSYGRCDFTHLREAVSEANSGSRHSATPFDPAYYPGHQMVEGVNYNSLDRIVTAFVDAALLPAAQPSREGEAVKLLEPFAAKARQFSAQGDGLALIQMDFAHFRRAAHFLDTTPSTDTPDNAEVRELVEAATAELRSYAGDLPPNSQRVRRLGEIVDLLTRLSTASTQGEAGERELAYYHSSTCACTAAERYVETCPKHGIPNTKGTGQ
ncbi:hypothetical protein [Sphingomonas soli]|uniref:hypothetical protein n=1 Tax=Sphingomonas soli TaxID=266127 RepID=UPI000834A8CF|nr:hypothetical protein [Sphingomonas soli]